MTDCYIRVALTTVGTGAAAHYLAETLVSEGLAACVNVLPGVVSFYRWQGELCRDNEWLLVLKSDAAHLPALEQRLLALHPYQTPAFTVLPARHVSDGYGRWLHDNLK